MDHHDHRRTAFEFLAHLGMTFEFGGERQDDNIWTGKKLIIRRRTNASELFHEAAHWIVAPPRRRRLENYGLGWPGAVALFGKSESLIVSSRKAQIEEEYASILGVALEYHLDANWVWTYDLHQWSVPSMRPPGDPPWFAIRRLMELEQCGILRAGYPTILDTIDTEEAP